MESQKQKGRRINPRVKCNIISALTFSWLIPIFWGGLKKEMDAEDLYEPLDEHASGRLGDNFSRLWAEEVKKAGDKRTPSLLRVILRAYAAKCMLYGFVLLIMECGIRLAQPLFLGRLVSYYIPNQTSITRTDAYYYAGGVIVCSILNVFFVHPYMMAILHMGMKFRVACCSLIYRKSLRLSKTALGETTVGQVVNLLSNDVNRFDVAVIFVHYLWIGPLATIIITWLMWKEIGWTAIVGVGVMLSFIPLQAYLGKQTSVLRLQTAYRTDERVRLMNEIISGIKVIKMYTWEKPFADLVAKARKSEINKIRATSYIRGVMTSFIMFTTRLCLFLSLLACVLVNNSISAQQVFVVASYYNVLRQTMTVFFPQGIAQVAEASISVKRLQMFMLYEDTSKPVPGLTDITTTKKIPPEDLKETVDRRPSRPSIGSINGMVDPTDQETVDEEKEAEESDPRFVRLRDANAKWKTEHPHSENTITDMSITFKPGKLIAVIGPVGAGKSSLLHVLLRELPLSSGSLHLTGTVSYASQEPWLFAGSVRQNILFGQPMDRRRYNYVVRRCALDRDFALFPHGDKTVVGERGVSLSGGQRARVSLARAVYKRADIYLLDDPLSAVDTHVGRHIFEACFMGFLRGTTRILVTHQLQFLKEVDQILILKNGSVAAAGNYETLSASGLDFAKLLSRDATDEERKSLAVDSAFDLLEDQKEKDQEAWKRQMSIHSANSVDNMTGLDLEPREEAESRSKGAVAGKVYGQYLRASGHPLVVTLMLSIAIIAQMLGSMSDWWTSYWVNMEESAQYSKEKREENYVKLEERASWLVNFTLLRDNVQQFENGLTRDEFIYIYAGLIILLVVITMLRSFMFFTMAMRASTRLHNMMFQCITRAPMRFFHLNPSGRILNRFSKDMGAVDEVLPSALLDVLQIGLALIGIVVVVAIVNYLLLIPTVVIGIIFYILRIFYLATSRSIKRLEGVTRSPVFSHLNASLQGITTIRAFNAQETLIREFDRHQDLHSAAWYIFIASSRAFGFWLDLVCVLYIAIVTMSFLMLGEDEYGGNVGLAITQAMSLTGMFQWGMRQSTELENQMTSVERIIEYSEIESEPSLESLPDKKPPPTWPERGRVEFSHVSLYYDELEPAVLKDLTFIVQERDKVGIVGRTGAGKSSLINALFRLNYIEGSIIIDDRDISTLGLHELRSQISIIPQEPVLFSGTMRHNLDPFDEYPDSMLWAALEEVELKEAVLDLAAGLNSRMSEGGSNFSVGQRQLVCLARAIVRRNRLLVMDEATANVDPQTDALIQKTIRNKFAECTVLTIAHRLHTIMDSDKVLVMDAGEVIEYDQPYLLLQNPESALRSMVDQTGRAMAEMLTRVAKEAYEKKTAPTASIEENT